MKQTSTLLITLLLISSLFTANAQKNYPFRYVPTFDGDHAFYNFTLPKGHLTNNFTIDFWTYLDDDNDKFAYFSMDDGESSFTFIQDAVAGTQDFHTDFYHKGKEYHATRVSSAANYKDKWIHIALVFHNNGTKTVNIDGLNIFVMDYLVDYYYNGVKHDQKHVYTDHILKDHDLKIYAGGFNRNHSWDFKGKMSMFRIWSRAMNAAEVNRYKNMAADYVADATGINDMRRDLIVAGYGHLDHPEKRWGKIRPTFGFSGIHTLQQTNPYASNILIPAPPTNIVAVPVCEGIELHRSGGTHIQNFTYRDGRCVEHPNAVYYNYYGKGATWDVIKGGSPGEKNSYQLRFLWNFDTRIMASEWSNTDNGNLFEVQPVTNPNNFKAEINCEKGIDLSWDPHNTPGYSTTNYNLYRSENKEDWQLIAGNYNKTTYTDEQSIMDKEFYYRLGTYENVAGNDMCADTSMTDDQQYMVTNRPLPSSAPALSSPRVSTTDDLNIQIDWNYDWYGEADSGKVTKVQLYSSQDGSSFNYTGIIAQLEGDSIQLLDTTAIMCHDYFYKLKGFNSCTSPENSTIWSQPSAQITKPSDFSYVLNHPDAFIDASKGYFNSKITVEWASNPLKKADIESYELYRRNLSDNGTTELIANFENNNRTSFEDLQSNANTMYLYSLVARGVCGSDVYYSDTITTLGFRRTTGIVSGNISYEGGNPVKNVEVQVEPDQSIKAHSVKSDSTGMYLKMIKTAAEAGIENMNQFTFESWFKPDTQHESNILTASGGKIKINVTATGIEAIIHDETETNSAIISKQISNSWQYVALVIDADSLRLIHKDSELSSARILLSIQSGSLSNADSIHIGTSVHPFHGLIDETRMWNTALDSAEIVKICHRQITPKNNLLRAYWQFDENWGDHAYDISNTKETYHKNHFFINGSYNWNDETPTFEQLHPAGETDKFGNYIIENIVYNGTGGIFKIIPRLGVHHFSPEVTNVYLGDNSPVHNKIDFIDKSSFKIPLSVTYTGTNIPVEEAEIFLDGEPLLDEGSNPIRTSGSGNDSISIPIGKHYISISKENHNFMNNGQFPPPTENEPYKTYNFQSDDLEINIVDSTFVKLAGRVVGGNQEAEKHLGFNKSTANIGMVRIAITSNYSGLDTTFTTDAESGEFMIELLPLAFKIDSVYNDHYDLLGGEGQSLSLTNVPELTTKHDSIYDGSNLVFVDSVQYHFTKKFIHYSDPQVKTFTPGHQTIVGETYIEAEADDGSTQKVELNTILAAPAFLSNKTYTVRALVEEQYINYQTGDTTTVPVENAQVTFDNKFSVDSDQSRFETNNEGSVTYSFVGGMPNMISPFTKTFKVFVSTQNGKNTTWPAGDNDYFSGYVLGNKQKEGNNFVTLGPEVPEIILHDPPGSNSYSYIEKGSSFSVSSSWNIQNNSDKALSGTLSLGVEKEIKFPFVSGIKLEAQNDLKAGLNMSYSRDKSGNLVSTYTFTERFETSTDPTITGSMSDVYIGESKNAYFSECEYLEVLPRSLVDANNLESLDNNKDFTIAKRNGFSMKPDSSRILFIYSKYHVIENLIPNLIELRNQLFFNKPESYNSILAADHPHFGISNESGLLAESGSSYEYTSGNNAPYDEVAFYNQQIDIWMQVVALSEEAVINAKKTGNISYDAGSGKYSREKEYTKESMSSVKTTKTFMYFLETANGLLLNKKGFKIETRNSTENVYSAENTSSSSSTVKFGYVIDDSELGDYFSIDIKEPDPSRTIHKENFLDDAIYTDETNNILNSLSLSGALKVFSFKKLGKLTKFGKTIKNMPKNILAGFNGRLNSYQNYRSYIQDQNGTILEMISGLELESPSFELVGGQSRCPWEDEEFSAFYMENGQNIQMQTGTQAQEGVKLEILPLIRTDVPENQPAIFQLELSNTSPTDKNMTYNLLVDEGSNSDGAIIRIDGLSPNRSFFLEANKTMIKTVSVEKGTQDAMNYDSLKLILQSVCDPYRFADTVMFNVHFKPSCTPVGLDIQDNWIVNINNESTLNVNVSEYDLNHTKLENIKFQYRQPGSTLYTQRSFFVSDSTNGYNAGDNTHELIGKRSDIDLVFNMENEVDGIYEVRAQSNCSDGTEYTTDFYRGVKDIIPPTPFGTPNPSDGVLAYGDDILIRFNEDIDQGDLQFNPDKIQMRGILNGTDLKHSEDLMNNASVFFDGTENHVSIPSVNLQNTSFSIEFWAKRSRTGEECLINQQSQEQGDLWIGFDNEGLFTVRIGDETAKSQQSYDGIIDEWSHFAVSYHIGSEMYARNITMTIGSSLNEGAVVKEVNSLLTSEGDLLVGKNIDGNTAFKGYIHELRIWNTNKSMNFLTSGKYKILNGSEENLMGYWPMNRAFGNIAEDKAGGRHGTIHASWYVDNQGKSLDLSGGYASFPIDAMSFDDQTDFTIEFWFYSGSVSQQECLFSNGSSEDTHWSIFLTPENEIKVTNFDKYLIAGLPDNTTNASWRHLALSVNRRGNTNIFLNGELISSVNSGAFGGFASDKALIGAHLNYYNQTETIDQPFTGMIDELRIWNATLNKYQIGNKMNQALSGVEAGLKAYFPFEDITITDKLETNGSFINYATYGGSLAGNFTFENSSFSDMVPNIKLGDPIKNIPVEFVTSGDEIYIKPLAAPYQIENRVLEISVSDIKDLNNNKLSSTVKWTAYVDRNTVVWDKDHIQAVVSPDQKSGFTTTIINRTGNAQFFEIENIPSWITISQTEGELKPQEQKEITATIESGLNFGLYSGEIHLISGIDYKEKLTLDIKVEPKKPDWVADGSDYRNSMMLIGQLQINGILSTDEDDMLGVFNKNQCVGVAGLQYFPDLNIYLVNTTIYGNNADEAPLELRIWDHSKGKLYVNASPEISFEPNSVAGRSTNPVIISTTGMETQIIPLTRGWNWISLNLESDKLKNLNMLTNNLQLLNGDLISGREHFDQYSAFGWEGSLSDNGGLTNTEMYKFYISSKDTLRHSGNPVNPAEHSIELNSGWNWIGYLPGNNMHIKAALSDIYPTTDDVIKSRHAFAIYDESLGWIGSMEWMEPGKGYMYKSGNQDKITFNFPVADALKSIPGDVISESFVPSNYPGNMNIIASVNTDRNISEANILCYNGKELIGGGSYNSVLGIFFITVAGDNNIKEMQYVLQTDQNKHLLNESVAFSDNKITGALDNPFIFSIDESSGISEQINAGVICYPNPFRKEMEILYTGDGAIESIEVFDISGAFTGKKIPGNRNSITVNETLIPEDGIFFIKVFTEDGMFLKKVIKGL